jgi:hypothetical protein
MANISTMARSKYVITQSDIDNGFAGIPMLWDSPFNDTNYNIAWSIHDTGQNFLSLDYAVGDVHFKTPAGFIAVITLPASAPFLQAQETITASTAVAPIVLMLPETATYTVSLYYGPSDATGTGTWSPVITWTDPAGNDQSLAYPYLGPATAGSVANFQNYSLPFYVKGGTNLVITGTYSAAPFPLNASISAVQTPVVSELPLPGLTIEIEAMASHR